MTHSCKTVVNHMISWENTEKLCQVTDLLKSENAVLGSYIKGERIKFINMGSLGKYSGFNVLAQVVGIGSTWLLVLASVLWIKWWPS